MSKNFLLELVINKYPKPLQRKKLGYMQSMRQMQWTDPFSSVFTSKKMQLGATTTDLGFFNSADKISVQENIKWEQDLPPKNDG